MNKSQKRGFCSPCVPSSSEAAMARKREPTDVRLLSRVARLYFEEHLTQLEIAEKLSLSRPKVSRLLQEAERSGLVQITVLPAPGVHPRLEKELERRFGLREAVVVEVTAPAQQESVVKELGAAAADHLQRTVREGDVIGISWGNTLNAMMTAVQLNPTCGTHVVQLIGGLGPPEADVHVTSLCRRLADLLGSKLTLIDAPGIVDSRRVKSAILSDSHTRAAFDLFPKMRVAYVGIGAPTPDSVVMRDGTIMSPQDLEGLRSNGAVGDIALRYFDIRGNAIRSELDERVIGITLDQLKRTPVVVGVAGGPNKDDVVRGALAGRFVNVLITDHALAQRLLDRDPASLEAEGKSS